MMNLFSDKIIQALCWTLLHSLWQGLLMAFITGIVMVISKKSSAALRYNLLSIIFILFITTVCFTFYNQLQPSPEIKTTEATVLPGAANLAGDVQSPGIQANAPSIQNYISRFTGYFNTHAALIVAIWFIIFMARCIKILSGLVNVQRLMHYRTNPPPPYWQKRISELATQLQINKAVMLLESAIVKVPVVVGFLKPTILVPIGLLANLSPSQVESILLHELAHIRRKDYFFNVLQRFADILFFFNPAVLWISSLIRNERENCCDDIAITESKSKKQFVQALVSFYEYNNAGSAYAMQFAGRKKRLVNRVKRIVNNDNEALNPVEKIVLAGSLLLCCFICLTIGRGQTPLPEKQHQQENTSLQKTNTASVSPAKNTPAPISNAVTKPGKPAANIAVVTIPEQQATAIVPQEKETGLQSAKITDTVPPEKWIELRQHGVTEDFMSSFVQAGYKNISLDLFRDLRDHGVSAGFLYSFYQLGYKDISPEKAIELKDHGVTTEFIIGLQNMGYRDISLKKARDLKDHGVTPEFISEFIRIGYTNISLEAAQQLRDHGVHPDFIKSFQDLGFQDIPLEKAQELRDHGVRPDFVKRFLDVGFKNISLDKAIELRDHGVDTGFIESIKKKTGSDHSLDEYIILKDQL